MYFIFSYLILKYELDQVIISETIFIEWERELEKQVKKKLDEKRKIYCKNILFSLDIFLVNYAIIYIINIKK